MTLSSQQNFVVYEGDGTQTEFFIPFFFFRPVDIHCYRIEDMLELPMSGFSVTAGNPASVVFSSPPASGLHFVIRRHTLRVQESSYPEAGRFPAKTLEHDLDRLVAMVQDLSGDMARALVLPADEDPAEMTQRLFSELSACEATAARVVDAAREHAMSAAAAKNEAAAAKDEAYAQAGRAEEARDEAERFAGQTKTIPPATETIRGGIRTGDGLVITDTDTLHVAMPLPQPGAGDEGKVLAVAAGSAGWQTPEVGASDLAALTQTAANMLPRSEYAADAPMRVYAHARITGAGEILHAHGIAGSVRVSAGNYQILLTRQLVNMTVICGLAGGTGTASFMGASGLVVDIRTWNNSYAAADGAFFVIICAGGVMGV